MQVDLRVLVFGSKEYESEVNLRQRELRDPLGLKLKPEDLEKEFSDINLGAFVDAKLVGCLVLTPVSEVVVKMRQVAIESSKQGQGIGKRLVQFCEAHCKQLGFTLIELNARETAIPFYKNLGYEIFGKPFEEVTIAHSKMRKNL